MCTYVPIVVDVPTEGGAQGRGKAPQRGVRRHPRSPADRNRPRRSRERHIQTGRLVRQRPGARARCVSWESVNETANSPARPCASPRLAPRQSASSRFPFVSPPRPFLHCAFPFAPFFYVAPAVSRGKGAASRGIGDTSQGAQQVINKNVRDQLGDGASRAATRTCRPARSFGP